MTLAEALTAAAAELAAKGVESPAREARLLLSLLPGYSLARQYDRSDQPFSDAAAFSPLVARRTAREPFAYIAGNEPFFGRPFVVKPAVLVPRPETEEVLEWFLERFAAGRETGPLRILDIGTGSGCLGLTAALELRRLGFSIAELVLLDLQAEALAVAAENSRRLAPDMKVTLLEADLWPPAGEDFDVLLSNPPYVDRTSLALLEPEVRDYEPRAALDGGPDGLQVFRRLAPGLAARLRKDGVGVLEHGFGQREAVRDLLTPFVSVTGALTDLTGHDRALYFQKRERA